MTAPILSVIVPVYNMEAGERLTWCMDSLTSQTYAAKHPGAMEIIAVDDASTDGSLALLKDYESRFPGLVHVIASPDNRHQGGAKNLGLAAARGSWIGFIDADDWIVPEFYERLLDEAERAGADMAGCDYSLVYSHTWEPGVRDPNNSPEQAGVLDEDKYRLLLIDPGSLVVKIYRREIIFGGESPESGAAAATGTQASSPEDASRPASVPVFPEHIFYEDNAVACSWMLRAKKFVYLPEALYFYYQHEASTVHTVRLSSLEDRLTAARLMLEAAEREGYFERYRPEMEWLFTNLFYRNTLFSAMSVYREGRKADFDVYGFTAALAREIKQTFPDFLRNPYVLSRVDAEERGFMALQMRSQALFFIKYRLLWIYRRLRYRG